MAEPTTASLFGEGPPPHRHDSATSRAAAEIVTPKAGTLRAKALDLLRDPLTDDEGARRLNVSGNTWRPRRVELVQAGLVRRVGTGRSATGNAAAVWQATEHVDRDGEQHVGRDGGAQGAAGDLLVQVLGRRPTWMGRKQLERLVREAVEAHKGDTAAGLRQVLADLEVLQ